jgi:hypothetical protein
MITFKKSEGVQTSNHKTCVWIQEIIYDFKRHTNAPIGKVVIDAEKITFYKFGLVMGIARHSTSGMVYSNGYLKYEGIENPCVIDKRMCIELFKLFNLSNPFG